MLYSWLVNLLTQLGNISYTRPEAYEPLKVTKEQYTVIIIIQSVSLYGIIAL